MSADFRLAVGLALVMACEREGRTSSPPQAPALEQPVQEPASASLIEELSAARPGTLRLRVPDTWRVPESSLAEPIPRGTVVAIQGEGVHVAGAWLMSDLELAERLREHPEGQPMIVLADPTLTGSLMAWLLDVSHAAGIDRFALVVGPPTSDGVYERAIVFSLPAQWPNADDEPDSVLVDIGSAQIMVAHHDGTIFSWMPAFARDGREWTELASRTTARTDDGATKRTRSLVIGETTPLADVVAAFTALEASHVHRVLALQRPSKDAFGPSITRDEIQANVRAQMGAIRTCYETALLTNPTLQGRVALRFAILPGGTVGSIEVLESSLPECQERTPMTQCLVVAVGAWVFPHQGAANTQVDYPFNFKPD